MIIQLVRSGGFAGMELRSTIDSAQLSAQENQRLEALLDAARFFEQPGRFQASSRGADRFHYVLTIQRGAQRHTVEADEGDLPEALQALLQEVALLARRFRGRS